MVDHRRGTKSNLSTTTAIIAILAALFGFINALASPLDTELAALWYILTALGFVVLAIGVVLPFLPSVFAAGSLPSSEPKSSRSSPVAIRITLRAAPITSPGRFCPWGP